MSSEAPAQERGSDAQRKALATRLAWQFVWALLVGKVIAILAQGLSVFGAQAWLDGVTWAYGLGLAVITTGAAWYYAVKRAER